MGKSKTYFCFAYPSDLDQAYAFYCARYENISFKEFLGLGITDFMRKFQSIPESEPLYKILKSRKIDLKKIKELNTYPFQETLEKNLLCMQD